MFSKNLNTSKQTCNKERNNKLTDDDVTSVPIGQTIDELGCYYRTCTFVNLQLLSFHIH